MAFSFECQGARCGATLDSAPGTTGLLLVSGGNEIRAGAFNSQARLAAEIARAGFPVVRFDRRGIGDSEGENREFRRSRKDIATALHAFRALALQVDRVIGFGNCDAASALMLAGGAECDGLVLSNPWTIEDGEDDTPPPAAVRSRYVEKLKNPRELLRLASGQVDLKKLARGLRQASKKQSAPSSLAGEMREGIAGFAGPIRILLADADRTAQVFAERWDAEDPRIRRCSGADHAYSSTEASAWLRTQILEALRG
nr:hydrolase 1, exosortase A system-associated [Qipengyuania qiaonensis]